MDSTVQEDKVAQLRRELDQLSAAILAATREGDIRRNAQLTLQACRLKKELLATQAQAGAH